MTDKKNLTPEEENRAVELNTGDLDAVSGGAVVSILGGISGVSAKADEAAAMRPNLGTAIISDKGVLGNTVPAASDDIVLPEI